MADEALLAPTAPAARATGRRPEPPNREPGRPRRTSPPVDASSSIPSGRRSARRSPTRRSTATGRCRWTCTCRRVARARFRASCGSTAARGCSAPARPRPSTGRRATRSRRRSTPGSPWPRSTTGIRARRRSRRSCTTPRPRCGTCVDSPTSSGSTPTGSESGASRPAATSPPCWPSSTTRSSRAPTASSARRAPWPRSSTSTASRMSTRCRRSSPPPRPSGSRSCSGPAATRRRSRSTCSSRGRRSPARRRAGWCRRSRT